jgi:hypothetical protein
MDEHGDAGQATFLMLVPILAGLVALTLLLMLGLGDGTRSRTQTRTAADAAALAAATQWRHALEDRYAHVVGLQPGWQPILLQLLAPNAPQTIAADTLAQAEIAARTFAARNGANVVSFGYIPTPGGVEYQVSTRSQGAAQVSNLHTTANAGASIRLLDGMCYVAGGTRFGIVIAGVCLDPWGANPPTVLPPGLPPTLPNPLHPVGLQDVAELVQ